MNKKSYLSLSAIAGVAASLAFALPAFASQMPMRMPPGIFGSVSAVNGTTLTVTSKFGPKGATATTYSVDASGATVTKNGTASSVSGIAVNDTVMIQGTINGTSVTAKTIRDSMMMRGRGTDDHEPQGTPTPPVIQGDGQPVIAGSVTAVNGTTLTITNKSNASYTIDASKTKIEKAGALSTLGSVAVGDNVVVQGTVNGTSVVATSVIDQKAPPANGPAHGGFLGGIGNFFKHLFGF